MKELRILLFTLVFLSVSSHSRGGDIISGKEDIAIYEAYIQKFKVQQDKPFNELLINTAKYFLGKPYIASTLEVSEEERLVVNLREFDCTTFVENCIVLSQVIKSDDLSYNNYTHLLSAMRYRNGEIAGYTSRLHYTCDWIYENQKRGVFTDISLKLGGHKVKKVINFMTTHPQLYKHLKDSPRNVELLKAIEDNIADRDSYEIIPVSKISGIEKNIKNGDIIVFATSIKGLDYSHIGIAYWQGAKLHFIHASSRSKKVVIESKALSAYCLNSKSCTGISVLRIN